MEHNRHRAPGRRPSTAGVVTLLTGMAIGAAGASAAWFISQDTSATPDAATALAATSDAGPEERSTEARNEIAIPTAAAAGPTDSTGSSNPVLLLGDSLAVGIAPYVDAGLGERALSVDAAEGRGTATSAALLESYAATSAPVWIVSLGTNDNPVDFPAAARSIARLAGAQRCVVWFDVWREGTDEAINDTLSAIASQHPNVHLIPWHETSALHTEWFSGTDVHPSSDGYAVRGQMAIDAVHEYCG